MSGPKDGNPGDVRNGDSGVCFHTCYGTSDEPVGRSGDYGPNHRPIRHPIRHPNRHTSRDGDSCGAARDGELTLNLPGSTGAVRS